MKIDWNKSPEKDAELVRLWNLGRSGGEIGLLFGVSANAIVGRITRLKASGVKLRGHQPGVTSHTPKKPKPPPRRAPKPPELKPEPILEPDCPRVTVMEARDQHCRWPYGEPSQPGFVYCGAKVAKGSFCAFHAAKAYQPSGGKQQGEVA